MLGPSTFACLTLLTMPIDLSRWIADLQAPEPDRRADAARALAEFGLEARPAGTALVRACGDPAEEVRQWAAAALEDLGPPAADDIPALAASLSDVHPDVAYWAATLLGRLEADGGDATKSLAHCLTDSTVPAVRQRAAWALGKIGPPAAAALPALEQAATDGDPRLSRCAREAIRQIRR